MKLSKIHAILLVVTLLAYLVPQTAHAVPKELKPVKEDPNLPRVLLIGDSISIGYTIPVRDCLKGVANVQRPETNCGPTTKGLKELDTWLGKKPWDVIHFNFGLHDLKYVNAKGQTVADLKQGKLQVPPDEYEKNLEKIAKKLKQTKAKLIWRNTTPVPKGAKGRIPGDAARYNEIALKVMKKYDIPVQDLHSLCLKKMSKIQRPANVHFTEKGYQLLAKEVAKEIKKTLNKHQ